MPVLYSHPEVEEDFKLAQQILSQNNPALLNRLIDSTLLKPHAQKEEYTKLCQEALEFKFRSVCLPPCYVNLAKIILKTSSTSVCTVIGFPNGYTHSTLKVSEVHKAIGEGADEIDFVQNVSYVKSGLWEKLKEEFIEISKAANDKVTKVILETALLTEDEISKCTWIAAEAGIHIIKTSTGFSTRGASLEDIEIIQKTLEKYLSLNNILLGIKASGGIKKIEDALSFLKSGATRFGTSNGRVILSGSTIEKNSY